MASPAPPQPGPIGAGPSDPGRAAPGRLPRAGAQRRGWPGVIGQALRPEGYEGAPLRAVETGSRRFRLLGELDLSNSEPLARFLAGSVAGEGDLTIDLRGLTFIDSAGLHLLIDCASALSGRGRLRLVEPRRSVARVIETTGLEWVPNLEVAGGDDAGAGHGTAVPVAPIDLSEPAGVSPPAGH